MFLLKVFIMKLKKAEGPKAAQIESLGGFGFDFIIQILIFWTLAIFSYLCIQKKTEITFRRKQLNIGLSIFSFALTRCRHPFGASYCLGLRAKISIPFI